MYIKVSGHSILKVTFRLGDLCHLPVKQVQWAATLIKDAHGTLKQGQEDPGRNVYCLLAWVQVYSRTSLQLQQAQEAKDFQPCVPMRKQPQKGPRH